MMLPTHVLVGMALATPVAVAVPDLAGPAVSGAGLGSIVPDLDVVGRHRRTLHFPTGYALAAAMAVGVALAVPAGPTVGLAAFLAGAAVHCRMDGYGGSPELRPWERTVDRAVYDHVRGRWRPARRWVRYDGSPGDLLAALVAAVLPAAVFEGPPRLLVAVAVAVAVVYAALRRRLPALVDAVADDEA